LIKRIISLFTVAALMALMVVAMAAPAFAEGQGPCPVCPVDQNDEAPGSFSTASNTVIFEPTNPNSLNAQNGIDTAHFNNINP